MSTISFPKKEEEILAFWEKHKIFKKSLEKPSPRGNFVFYEGPPTANGKPALHHVLARAFKDVIPRFKTMQGYKVVRRGGWDTHGLPVELQIEKQLGITRKQEIEALQVTSFESIKYFNELCRKSVWEYKEDWEKLTKRMGFWLDLDNAYITCTNEYIESLWWILWQAWKSRDQKGNALLFQGYKVVPFCTRCGTALSSHELAQGYKSVSETSVYMKFPLQDSHNTFFLSWTTTPWTLPGNVALAVGKDMQYVKVRQGTEHFILSKNRLQVLEGEYTIEEEYTGKELLGKKYKPLFTIPSFLQYQKNAQHRMYEIVEADFVTDQEGTGIVHTAVMYGEDDYNLGEQLGLPKHHTVLESGRFTDEVQDVAGMYVKSPEASKILLENLASQNLSYKQELYKHDYPFCWRCDTSLIYYARNSWFIRMSALREEIKMNNEAVHWIPEHIKEGRFGEWLEGVKDWAISRERYWGTPLPIWKCENTKCAAHQFLDGHDNLPASIQKIRRELQKKGYPQDYHRPYIDMVKFPCVQCGGTTRRVSEVIDVWFDSGGMPFAQWHYPFEKRNYIEEGIQYPADYIAEAIDQTRGWFYTLLAIATFLKHTRAITNGVVYKNVISLGHILDKHGKKMSKSKGNVIDPWDIMNIYGVDALRFHLFTMSQPGEPKRFDPEDVKKVVQKYWLILWNVVRFYTMFRKEQEQDSQLEIKDQTDPVHTQTNASIDDTEWPKTKNIMDRWLLVKLNTLIVQVTNGLETYQITESARAIGIFITELSKWYLRRSRERFKSDQRTVKDEAMNTLRYTLLQLAKLMAPLTPFLADALYQEVNNLQNSVHLDVWPVSHRPVKEDEKILAQMESVRDLVEAGLAEREKRGIKLRQPLAKAMITKRLHREFLDILSEELNVEKVEISEKLSATRQKHKENADAGKQMFETRLIHLDTTLTPELKAKGLLRDLIRQVNAARKKAGFSIKNIVQVEYQTDNQGLKNVIETYERQLLHGTLSASWKEIKIQDSEGMYCFSCIVNDIPIVFAFKR
ncbi:MAG: hypothetical protein A3B74_04470 [Candidatus Kerfeldbacteria bacterium RIFCSPHIGHO2_02_FULL_42_14]|uniref:Isoleucine--tRNA ligase n=1 Tax=Candidatus Kerfeldbacteria bacterium RIFCSPHIGHO2_02_FULL_42_14 TaxID=1798540 RepID=A0A1G2ANX0_9BACT|nr:MAG: hypothetical protein A3B74_04470 [Candidatus Kerfeldbacteria bacterium RIFCSPHIGHO2_02_FULL_42_14]OGY80810.1 MAG: hypothetical protein A3E60_01350 [Candidatus Kerfeldbacteria bacterium RIFCSPHIGHO2_12_FULL_42_13]OGY84981.1 MAG: hypothetical protein A3I91_00685 [Candidatus Kerfeldbacteria bacterium RIFCSPLOWO2_02_FULL_42_19]